LARVIDGVERRRLRLQSRRRRVLQADESNDRTIWPLGVRQSEVSDRQLRARRTVSAVGQPRNDAVSGIAGGNRRFDQGRPGAQARRLDPGDAVRLGGVKAWRRGGWLCAALVGVTVACAQHLPDQDLRILEASPAAKLTPEDLWRDFQANRAAA